jgi:hypothetical protein
MKVTNTIRGLPEERQFPRLLVQGVGLAKLPVEPWDTAFAMRPGETAFLHACVEGHNIRLATERHAR